MCINIKHILFLTLLHQSNMSQIMKAPHAFLTFNLLILSSFFFLLPAKTADSKTDLSALLSFKTLITADPLATLSSWNGSLPHCQWPGVLCGRHHRDRVTALVLDSKQLSGHISPSLANLTFLQKISLSDNQLRGSIPLELGYLSRLRFVSLSMNYLHGNIPFTLGNCSNLKFIDFSHNNLTGSIPAILDKLTNLSHLFLYNNSFSGSIQPTLGHLINLSFLYLDQNNFNGHIPPALGNLTNLKVLSLYQNRINGPIPYVLGNLTNLLLFYLDHNSISGSIPPTLGNLIHTQEIYLHNNLLTGPIPATMGNLTNLLYLHLEENKLNGSIPHTLGNLNNIVDISLYQNMLSGSIPAALGKLQRLQLFDIFSNNVSDEIPHSLYNISSMVNLELGNNQLNGTLSFNICDVLSDLQYLNIYENKLRGQIPSSISNCSSLLHLELNNNYITGTIPSSIGTLKSLRRLILGTNQLVAKGPHDWNFVDALTNCTFLQKLYLGDNQLKGVIHSSITNLSTSLLEISLGDNSISGTIPRGFHKLTNLNTLLLGQMLLNGTISEEIGNLFGLEFLDLSNNMISGPIPSTFTNLTRIVKLFMNNNALEGNIPSELSNMQALELLDFSNNRFVGKIPKEIMGLRSLSVHLDLSHNYLTGFLPPEIGNLKNLQSIHLSNNKLSGELPKTIDGCQVLQILYIDGNLFHGAIPSSMSNLRGLQKLDISSNSFSGNIPEFMGRMNLQYLNISFNNFDGELPNEGIFKDNKDIDLRGNPKLCGGVPEMHLPQCVANFSTQRHHSQKSVVIICSVLGASIFLTVAMCHFIARPSKKRPQNSPKANIALKFEIPFVSYNDLLRATENFSLKNLIGRGSFGAVYKANMNIENVTVVAVKVLNLLEHGASRSFFSECKTLRNVRHRNLIKVFSVCSSIDHQGNDFKALVFEFMSNGSLEASLHPNACKNPPLQCLSMVQRLKIAIDVAVGLDYLHHHVPTPIIHCDLKPSNVLLDDDMSARVADFGLARFLIRPDTVASQSVTSTSGIKGSIGYIPPEYGMGNQPSAEGDVYSYGILLLEMFIGVSPTDERFRDGLSLYKYIEMSFPAQIMDIVDTKMFSEIDGEANAYAPEIVHGCLVSVIQCGLLCSKESPKERITIKDVLKELDSARTKLDSVRSLYLL